MSDIARVLLRPGSTKAGAVLARLQDGTRPERRLPTPSSQPMPPSDGSAEIGESACVHGSASVADGDVELSK